MDVIKEQKELQVIIAKARKNLKLAPEEDLLVSKTPFGLQFYARGKGQNRTYISKQNTRVLRALAIKRYNETILKSLPKQKIRIDHFLKFYNPNAVYEVYESMPAELKPLVTPYALSDEMYAQQWDERDCDTKGIRIGDKCYTTDLGEKVRSKSELTIANKLHSMGIKYKYEKSLFLHGYGTIYPDFTILNPKTREEVLLEHFGLMDNHEYVQTCLRKLNSYANNGIYPGHGLIITYESEECPLNTEILEKMLKAFISQTA